MKLIVPLVLAISGLASGVGAGIVLRPEPALPEVKSADTPCGNPSDAAEAKEQYDDGPGRTRADDPIFVTLDHQFVVPVIEDGRVDALVVLSLSLETTPSAQDAAQTRKPRLRDRFLRVMLDHANTGGFAGSFTSNGQLDRLKNALFETARAEIGPGLYDVLILDIVKQSA